MMLAALLIGAALIVTDHATTPEAAAYVSPVFTMAGVTIHGRHQ
ncbi:hypothetical protein [Streptomyces sp. NA02950]|nr:hypothetical protein [Streptomyces sp. NA02950]